MAREKLFKIGEVMQESGLSRQTLHNYTLAGLILEARRTPAGHRLYGESVFESIEQIKRLQLDGLTLSQIKRNFDDQRRQEELQQKKQLSINFE